MNVFKKILIQIKNIFNKIIYIKQIIRKSDDFEKKEKDSNEIKEDFINEKSKLEELLGKIEVGDIIWAKRYKDKIEEDEIPEQHKEGPFIVIEKIEEGLVCVYGTGTESKHENINFILNNDEYSLRKETNFILYDVRLIDNNSFIKKLDKLTSIDKNRLYKQLKKSNIRHYHINDERKIFRFPFQIGDIIKKQNNKYIIIDIKENKMFCIPICKSNIDSKFKNLDYSKLIILDKNCDYQVSNTVDDKTIIYILNKYKEFLYNIKNQNNTQRGSVIKKENKLHYVYGEEGQEWLIFEISEIEFVDFEKIVINNKKYYTDFSKATRINKKDNFKTISLATDNEKDMIKEIKKNHIKQNQKKQQKSKLTKPEILTFNVGDIVQYKNKKFFILTVCSKFCECLSINELKQCIKLKIFLSKKDIKKINYNKIKGIKWLEENPKFDFKNINKEEIIEEIINVQKQFIDIEKAAENTDNFQKCYK